MTVYYFPRFLSIKLEDYSANPDLYNILGRIRPTSVEDFNHTLFFLFFANIFIFAGLSIANKKLCKLGINTSYNVNQIDDIPIKYFRIKACIILSIVSLFSSLHFVFIDPLATSRSPILSYVNVIFTPYLILLIGSTYLFIYFKNKAFYHLLDISRSPISLTVFLIVGLSVVIRVIVGSRSAIIGFIETLFFLSLVLGIYKIRKNLVLIFLLFSLLSFPLFVLSSASRQVKANQVDQSENISIIDFVQNNFIDVIPQTFQKFTASNLAETLAPAFSRASFLDMSVDTIKNSNDYRKVVNPVYYIKSLVDNLFTPGFNIFDVLKVSNALRGIYTVGRPLSMSESKDYHSDQINIYGEYYTLFWGWVSIPFFFISAYCFRLITYYRLREQSLTNLILKFFWAKTFYGWLTSFGLDWIIIDTVFNYILLRFYIFLFIRKPRVKPRLK
ncbi:hypothetical protein [Cylindrospermopsis raciborskii]|uniref:hypothetical protein n=3 Tax=Cylindrospermopsis raciborskii TaxID=77022 RepID=UPI0011AF5D45|nr:hypothetical protein [Cylindrospermopsis raciborskii]